MENDQVSIMHNVILTGRLSGTLAGWDGRPGVLMNVSWRSTSSGMEEIQGGISGKRMLSNGLGIEIEGWARWGRSAGRGCVGGQSDGK